MTTPKTVRGYLKLLIQISKDSSWDLRNSTEDERNFIGNIRAGIQNELGEDEYKILEKYNLPKEEKP